MTGVIRCPSCSIHEYAQAKYMVRWTLRLAVEKISQIMLKNIGFRTDSNRPRKLCCFAKHGAYGVNLIL